jgi:hypothetical protein
MTTEYTLGEACRHWLSLGFDLLPIQPNTKYILSGYGIHQKRISTIEDAEENIITPGRNVAVICKGENFILDFDDWDIYKHWLKNTDEVFTTSYTEHTRRGAHVWLCGDVLRGLNLIDGVEIKKICIVAPSVVGGYEYMRGDMDIFAGDVDRAFLSLSRPGFPSPYLLRMREHEAQNDPPATARIVTNGDLISRIKSAWNIETVFTKLSPTAKSLRGQGRYKYAVCPFHKNGKEKNPSFWLDVDLGLYGCHVCMAKKPGDVINLYASLTHRSLADAIQAMKSEAVQ